VFGGVGCYTATGDSVPTISFSPVELVGKSIEVEVVRRRSAEKPCSFEINYGNNSTPAVVCAENVRDYGKVERLSCVPKEACEDITIVDGKGSLVPVAERFQLNVVGSFDGSPMESTESFTLKAPVGHITLEGAAGVEARVCLQSELPATLEQKTPDGATSPIELGPSSNPWNKSCGTAKLASGAELIARLQRPSIEIARLSVP
jgi:hypothetical protein